MLTSASACPGWSRTRRHAYEDVSMAPGSPGRGHNQRIRSVRADPSCSRLRGRLDLDPARLGPLGLRQDQPEDAVAHLGADAGPIDLVAQDERAVELARPVFFVDQAGIFGHR